MQKEFINEKKIRFGLIGCGRIAHKHIDSLTKHKNFAEIVAVCDKSEVRVNELANQIGAKPYFNIEQMLKKEKLDAVTIMTPNGTHLEHVKLVADHNIHPIVEKPMAIDIDSGIEMVNYCKEKNVRLFVVYQNRFNNTIQAIWNAKKMGRFGKIYMIISNVLWYRPDEYYSGDLNWHGNKILDGGAFYTQASHYIDFMSWIANSAPKKVYANLKTFARKIETEDAGMANIEWNNGIIGSINVTVLTFPKNLEGSVTIIGEKGTVKIGGVALNEIQHWEFEDKLEIDSEIKKVNYITDDVYGFGHENYYENVIKSLNGNESPLIDGNEGLKSLKLLDAIYKSSSKQQIIFF